MDNKKFAQALEDRTKKIAINIMRLSCALPHTPESVIIRKQITKSGTSIGANYREANRARSRADFKNRIKICESEASETQYWLEIIMETKWIAQEKVKAHYMECRELLVLFTTIGKNS
jgi:four helix bundle protein